MALVNELVFASGNRGKTEEIQAMLGDQIRLLSLKDLGFEGVIEENGATLQANASIKARFVKAKFGKDCFADDTGLEVFALGMRPGVHSARYAGDPGDAASNSKKLLSELDGISDRRARFRTVFCLLMDNEEHFFEGIADGHIADLPRGEGGFGYDSVFIPEGDSRTFAEMSREEKNTLSHRGKALRQLVGFLRCH
jgi:XTP/dITP diphosphohydrolase